MLFRVPGVPEALRAEQLDIARTNNDKELFELALAATINGQQTWLERQIADDLASGVVWRKQRAGKLAGFTSGNTLPVEEAWPEGPADLRTSRRREAASWRHREASARYWWNRYWHVKSDEDAYAAWVLFMETADRRVYGWMNLKDGGLDVANPTIGRRQAHFEANQDTLRSAVNKHEKQMDRQFLGRKVVDGIGPWGKEIE